MATVTMYSLTFSHYKTTAYTGGTVCASKKTYNLVQTV